MRPYRLFSGVGNSIRNEVLFRIHVHPATHVGDLPPRKLDQPIAQACEYSFDFLAWKRLYALRKHWPVHTRQAFPVCGRPIGKAYLGTTQRHTSFCTHCQMDYSAGQAPAP